MKPDLGADDDDVLRSLLGGRPPAGACPDPGLLAAWVEDRLEGARRDVVEEHLALCDACRSATLALRDDALAASALPAAGRGPAVFLPFRRRVLPALAALAAVVLVGVGVAWFLRPEPDVAARLSAAAEAAERARPDLLAGFRPLSPSELSGGGADVLRGGLAVLEPSAHVLAPPATLRWTAVPGATLYRVTLLDGAGLPLWTRETADPSLAWPAGEPIVAPGTQAVLEVVAETVLGQAEGRRAFAVVGADEARSFADAARSLASEEPGLADLLRAHLALRRGFVTEALAAARAQAARTPDDALTRETLAHALRLAGEPTR